MRSAPRWQIRRLTCGSRRLSGHFSIDCGPMSKLSQLRSSSRLRGCWSRKSSLTMTPSPFAIRFRMRYDHPTATMARSFHQDPEKCRPEKITFCVHGVISPLLSNIYLHYVFDLWAQQWRTRRARGDMVIIRYADDTVLGFEHRFEADQFLADLKERAQAFGLSLHPEKTRLIA